jgi:hypothetical protein
MTRRRALLLAALAALFWLCRRAYWLGCFNDDAFYLIGARSLLHGRFAELQAPGAPPLVYYLPGWPLLLAPGAALARGSVELLRAYAIGVHLAALALLGAVFDREAGPELSDLALAAVAVSPLISSTAATLLADGPMLFCAAAALAFLPRLWERRDAAAWLGFGLALGLAAVVRPNGLTLAAGVAGALLWEKRPREAAAALLPAGAVLVAWTARNALAGGAAWNHLSEAASGVGGGMVSPAANALFYARELFARALWRPPLAWPPLAWLAALTGTALAFLGLRELRTPAGRAAALFCGLYLLPLLIYDRRASRYLIPVLPFALLSAWLGLRRLGGRRAALAGAALCLVLSGWATAGVLRASFAPSRRVSNPPARAAAWLRAHAPRDAVLAAEFDGRWSLLTGLHAVHVPYDARDSAALARFVRQDGVSLVVVESQNGALRPSGGPYAAPDASVLSARLAAVPGASRAFSDPGEGVEVWRVPAAKKITARDGESRRRGPLRQR